MAAVATDGYDWEAGCNNGRYRERVLYVQPGRSGGKITARDNLVDPVATADKVCSDRRRIETRVTEGGIKRHQLATYRACTNCAISSVHAGVSPACVRSHADPFKPIKTSLNSLPDQSFQAASTLACPITNAHAGTRLASPASPIRRRAWPTKPNTQTVCAYPCTDPDDASSVLPCNESASCPPHWTSHHTSTGCRAYCNAAFQPMATMALAPAGLVANYLDADRFLKNTSTSRRFVSAAPSSQVS